MADARPAVAIVGAGAVAQALGRLMMTGGMPVVALANRSADRARRAAAFIGAGSVTGRPPDVVDLTEVPRRASRVLIAVSDSAIGTVAQTLASSGMEAGIALHTCGARGPDALNALREVGVSCGLLHPLQTIMAPEQGVGSLAGTIFGLSGDESALQWGDEIVRIVAGADGGSLRLESDRLSYYHAGAVMASNAIVAALDAAVDLLEEAGVDNETALRAIAPLSRTSLSNALATGPVAALTGPIARGDATTVAAHLEVLRHAQPTVAGLYTAAAAHLLHMAKRRGLSVTGAQAVAATLERREW
jgi:predicted short-subunit dehydrogenase-like oxidoreductase (DUF2520 family)